uniref:Uncharacterized protein n=1 Tax=Oryza brachyantha TaxID=4533 RepID=J3LYF0_ORYBR
MRKRLPIPPLPLTNQTFKTRHGRNASRAYATPPRVHAHKPSAKPRSPYEAI